MIIMTNCIIIKNANAIAGIPDTSISYAEYYDDFSYTGLTNIITNACTCKPKSEWDKSYQNDGAWCIYADKATWNLNDPIYCKCNNLFGDYSYCGSSSGNCSYCNDHLCEADEYTVWNNLSESLIMPTFAGCTTKCPNSCQGRNIDQNVSISGGRECEEYEEIRPNNNCYCSRGEYHQYMNCQCQYGYFCTKNCVTPNDSNITCTECPENATCDADISSRFKCNKGYYDDEEYAEMGSCVKCPAQKDIDNNTVSTSNAGAVGITACYVPTNKTFKDRIGEYSYTQICHYSY